MTLPPPTSGSDSGPTPSTGTSRSLLQRARANEPAAWERLVTLYAPLVLHWCRQSGLQEPDAADVFQEVFQAVARHLRDFRKEQPSDTFRGWLRAITRNKVRDHYRRLGREPGGAGGTDAQQRLLDVAAPAVTEDDSGDAEHAVFLRALELVRGEFTERTWQAFWRTAVDERLPRDVGAELAMSPGAVRVAKSRVLQRLREELGDLGE